MTDRRLRELMEPGYGRRAPGRRLGWLYPALVAAAVLWSSFEAVSKDGPVADGTVPVEHEAAEIPAAAGNGSAAATAPSKKASPGKPGAASMDTLCVSDEAMVLELRRREQAVSEKEKALALREVELSERETALVEQMRRLEEIRAEIAGIEAAQEKAREERVAKLVETVEKMSPKSAAKLIAELDEGLAVTAMSRIETMKLAKILNQIEPAKSSRLSELMTTGKAADRGPSGKANGKN